ncbi:MAG: DUF4080 domain-containing protein [Mogibacterium sp.]|nr:DUF4080 domain-containing protein [Mogibacterium sp.]
MKLLLSTIRNDCIHTKLSLKYLYSIVADAPCETEVRIFEESDHLGYIYKEIVRSGYHILYFHCNMMNEARISQIAEMAKKAVPTSIVVLGGMEVSFDTKAYMESHPWVDYVFRGESEQLLYQFLKTIFTYEFDFAGIAGLAYRENDEIHVNPYAAPIRFEDVPFPYEKTDLDESDCVYYESFRGNPDRCYYSQFLPDRKIRALSLGRVCTELRYFLVKNVKSVRFIDKWFNYNTERAYRIWEYLISNDNGITTFEFDVNGDLLDEETIRLLASAREGQFRFLVDVESTNAEALAAAGRKENVYQAMYNLTKLLQTGKVEIVVHQTAGLPCEPPESFARSFNKIYGLGADRIDLGLLRLRKGTRLRQEADRYGFVYRSDAPYEIIASDFMPATELIRIRMVADLLDVYYNKGGFEQSIPVILRETNTRPYVFYAGLADFIYDNHLDCKMGKKEHLYRILYAYAMELYDDANETLKLEVLKEVIHSDLEHNLSPDSVRKFDRKGWEILS